MTALTRAISSGSVISSMTMYFSSDMAGLRMVMAPPRSYPVAQEATTRRRPRFAVLSPTRRVNPTIPAPEPNERPVSRSPDVLALRPAYQGAHPRLPHQRPDGPPCRVDDRVPYPAEQQRRPPHRPRPAHRQHARRAVPRA